MERFVVKIALCIGFFVLFNIPVHSVRLKKVVILDFKNIDRNPDYQYLEASITDAVREDLKKRFAFQEMEPEAWRKAARDNYFLWPEENFTKGFAMQLGLMARQDVVIGGYYQAITLSKKKARTPSQVIRSHVFILDIGRKTLISEFDMQFAADATLFNSVGLIANRVADESKAVLPNEKDFNRGNLDDEEMGRNEFALSAGMNIFSQPTAFTDNFSSGTNLFPKDIKNLPQVEASFTRHDFWKQHMQISLLAGMQFGSTNLSVVTDTKPIRASLLGISSAAHIGYRFDFWRLYLTPFAGGGFYFGNITLDYSTLTVLPVDGKGNPKSSATLNVSAPFAEFGVHLGVQINRILAIQLTAQYRQYAYVGADAGQGYFGAGFSFRL